MLIQGRQGLTTFHALEYVRRRRGGESARIIDAVGPFSHNAVLSVTHYSAIGCSVLYPAGTWWGRGTPVAQIASQPVRLWPHPRSPGLCEGCSDGCGSGNHDRVLHRPQPQDHDSDGLDLRGTVLSGPQRCKQRRWGIERQEVRGAKGLPLAGASGRYPYSTRPRL